MATYVSGVQPYLPDWQPFTPDYKFLSDVLQVRTDRYNTNYKALNDLYSKVVYSDLSRQDTQEARNQYAETLGKQLETISGMDLSIAQNVDAAKQLFKPFYENDLIVKDLVFTKQYQKEMRYANVLMNSPDEAQREMWWAQGVKALDYQMQDFQNGSQDQALAMGLPRYVKDADLYEKALKFLDELGLEKEDTFISEDGFWMVKQKNGALVTQEAFAAAQRALMDDPLVQQAYQTDAYVKSRDFAAAGIQAGQFSSVDEGQRAWAEETVGRIQTELAARALGQEIDLTNKKNANVNWENYINQQGIIPGSDEEREYQEQQSSYQAALMKLQSTEQALKSSTGNPGQSTQGLLNRAYNLLMSYNLQGDLSAAAMTYASKSASRDLEVNQYKKQQLQFDHDFSKMAQRFQYDLQLRAVDFANDKELELIKNGLGPYSNMLNKLLGVSTTYTKAGTVQTLEPQKGETYIDVLNAKNEQLRVGITQQQVEVSLAALEKFKPNSNNFYVVNENIKGSLPEIKSKLLLPENAGIAEDLFMEMREYFSTPNKAKVQNPNFVVENNGKSYHDLQNKFSEIERERLAFDGTLTMGNQVVYDNYMKALDTEITSDAKKITSELANGVPPIFTNNSSGALEMMGEEEYLQKYLELARDKKIISGDGYKGYTSTSGYYADNERDAQGNLTKSKWNNIVATKAARKAYERQINLVSATLDGSLNTTAAEEGISTAGERMFQPWDPQQAMRGVGLTEMQEGDVIVNPYYSTQINPKQMGTDLNQFSALTEVVNQVNSTPTPNLTFYSGDIGTKEGDLSEDLKARRVYEAWIQDLSKFADPKASRTNLPKATISYAPAYGPSGGKTLDRVNAAYVITFDPTWLKTIQGTDKKPSIIGPADLPNYSQITISFPQNADLNPKKSTNFSFSQTVNELMYSDQKQVVRTIPNGGVLRVYPDANNNYIMETIGKQYNSTTGNFDNLPPIQTNLSELQITEDESISYIDALVNQQLKSLQLVAQDNIANQKANKKTKGVN